MAALPLERHNFVNNEPGWKLYQFLLEYAKNPGMAHPVLYYNPVDTALYVHNLDYLVRRYATVTTGKFHDNPYPQQIVNNVMQVVQHLANSDPRVMQRIPLWYYNVPSVMNIKMNPHGKLSGFAATLQKPLMPPELRNMPQKVDAWDLWTKVTQSGTWQDTFHDTALMNDINDGISYNTGYVPDVDVPHRPSTDLDNRVLNLVRIFRRIQMGRARFLTDSDYDPTNFRPDPDTLGPAGRDEPCGVVDPRSLPDLLSVWDSS
jgi:hypothetical protein